MNLNFIWTHGDFKYQYYLAVLSAMNVHTYDKAILWTCMHEKSPYIELLKDKGLTITYFTKHSFNAYKRNDVMGGAYEKDYMLWRIGYTYGGMFLDLDTVSVNDMSGLLGDKDMVVPLDIENEIDCEHPFNNAIMIMSPMSPVVKDLLDEAERILAQESVKWGDTGPALLTNIVRKNRDRIAIAPFRTLGGFGGNERDLIYSQNVALRQETSVLHAFAIASESMFGQVSPEFIRGSLSPYATAVKSAIQKPEWDLFSVNEWLSYRGRHYKPMYDWLRTHEVYTVLEIGTYNGDNAIGMISTIPLPNREISYYGFDLFAPTTGEQEKIEATTGYNNPPDVSTVFSHIMNATGAHVELHKGPSSISLPETELPIMDFIYIDGGHSPETILADWNNVQKCIGPNTIIFFDDYFIGRTDIGCLFLSKKIPVQYEAKIVGDIDDYTEYSAQLMQVNLRNEITIVGSNKLCFHLLGLAHVPTNRDVSMCAYTQKVVKLSRMLTELGHKVILYAGEGSEAVCSEMVECVTDAERKQCYGDYDWRKEFFKHSGTDFAYTTFNARATAEINKRKNPRDILLAPMGNYNKSVSDNTGLLTIESGIGYEGTFAPYRVFESYAWMHYIYGKFGVGDGSNYDVVIPNYFYPEDFAFQPEKKDYFLFIGRLIGRKGLQIAVDATKRIGARLLVAGQGSLININEGLNIADKHVAHVGSVGPEKRSELMGNARAVFVPTIYIEPFGGVAVEAMMCGTPVITSDWGAMVETVIHGKTGYRCRTLNDYIWAADNIGNINPQDCRDYAISNYSANRIALMYDEYFHKVMDLWEAGWYTQYPQTKKLDWLNRVYP